MNSRTIVCSRLRQVGILEDVYEFRLPVYLYEREGKGLNEPFHQITDSLQQENYVRSYVCALICVELIQSLYINI